MLHTLRPVTVSAAALLAAGVLAAVAAAPARAAVTQPPEPVDPSPNNGQTYYMINQASGLQADLDGDGIVQNPRSFTNLSQRWAMAKAPDGNWLISDVGSGQCLDSASAGAVTRAVQDRCRAGVATQEWSFTYNANGYHTITNAATGLVLDTSESSTAPGARLIQSVLAGAPTLTQSWLLRPTYFLGNDSSLQSKAEFDRVAANSASAPWWHDGYLPGQDLLQIMKNQGTNMIRVRPASINTTVVHDGVTFPITTAPYNNYTLAPPPASQIIPASANPASPGGTSSGNHAQTDWSAVDLAKRAKLLGMSVNVTLFYSGDNTSETPGNWAGKTVDQLAGVPPTAGLMYDYVKQEMELFRANGAWPDLVSIGNEVNNGMFTTSRDAGDCRRRLRRVRPGAARTSAAATADLYPRRRQPRPADLLRWRDPDERDPARRRVRELLPRLARATDRDPAGMASVQRDELRQHRPARRAGQHDRGGERARSADLHHGGRCLLHHPGRPAGPLLRRQPPGPVPDAVPAGHDRP